MSPLAIDAARLWEFRCILRLLRAHDISLFTGTQCFFLSWQELVLTRCTLENYRTHVWNVHHATHRLDPCVSRSAGLAAVVRCCLAGNGHMGVLTTELKLSLLLREPQCDVDVLTDMGRRGCCRALKQNRSTCTASGAAEGSSGSGSSFQDVPWDSRRFPEVSSDTLAAQGKSANFKLSFCV